MRILGIDPGTRIVGYGVIDLKGSQLVPVAGGVIRTFPKEAMAKRLLMIHEHLLTVIERVKPDVAAVEQVFHGRNTSTLIKIGEARGVILSACASAGVEAMGHSPAEVKKAVTGNGRASKEQVRDMVTVLLGKGLELETHDVSDALAIAICQANRSRFQSMGLG